jgi:hypothetical protein
LGGFELEPDVAGNVGLERGELQRSVRHTKGHCVVKQV